MPVGVGPNFTARTLYKIQSVRATQFEELPTGIFRYRYNRAYTFPFCCASVNEKKNATRCLPQDEKCYLIALRLLLSWIWGRNAALGRLAGENTFRRHANRWQPPAGAAVGGLSLDGGIASWGLSSDGSCLTTLCALAWHFAPIRRTCPSLAS